MSTALTIPQKRDALLGFMSKNEGALTSRLGRTMEMVAFRAGVVDAFESAKSKGLDLWRADYESIKQTVLFCAAAGLNPGPAYREVALVPFKGKMTPIVEYRGAIKRVKMAYPECWYDCEAICEGDTWEYWKDEHGPHYKHVKPLKGRGEVQGAFWAFRAHPGAPLSLEIVTQEDGEKARAVATRNRNGKTPQPWVDYPDQMYIKTGIHRWSKRQVLAPNLAALMDLMGRADGGETVEIRDADVEMVQTEEPEGAPEGDEEFGDAAVTRELRMQAAHALAKLSRAGAAETLHSHGYTLSAKDAHEAATYEALFADQGSPDEEAAAILKDAEAGLNYGGSLPGTGEQ